MLVVALDIDTLWGTSPRLYCPILRIAATVAHVLGDRQTGPIEHFAVIVNNHCLLPPYISELTGITQQMVNAGVEIDRAYALLLHFLTRMGNSYEHPKYVMLTWNSHPLDLLSVQCKQQSNPHEDGIERDLARAGVHCHIDLSLLLGRTNATPSQFHGSSNSSCHACSRDGGASGSCANAQLHLIGGMLGQPREPRAADLPSSTLLELALTRRDFRQSLFDIVYSE